MDAMNSCVVIPFIAINRKMGSNRQTPIGTPMKNIANITINIVVNSIL